MTLKSNFELMANYNQWMNNNIYNAASNLNRQELNLDRGAFFGSIMGTLNHITIGDIIWLKRFYEHEVKFHTLNEINEMESPKTLNEVLYPELSELTVFRKQLDQTIINFIQELTEEVISLPLTYKNTKGQPFTRNFGHLLQHFFNHQTHHRGQASTLLNQTDIDIGVTDLLACIPNITK